MKKCKFDDFIDDYLLNKLKEEDKEKFEEHYFNCEQCFEKLTERNELLSVIKNQGQIIFQDEERKEDKKETFSIEKILSFFTPKQWAYAAASVAILLVFLLNVVPIFKKTPPHPYQFKMDNENIVRGESIRLISPVINVNTVPSQFKWEKLEGDVEYKICIYNNKLLWSTLTKENFIDLPEEVKNLMQMQQKYSWQVKAFSLQGVLTAVSPKVQFKITSVE